MQLHATGQFETLVHVLRRWQPKCESQCDSHADIDADIDATKVPEGSYDGLEGLDLVYEALETNYFNLGVHVLHLKPVAAELPAAFEERALVRLTPFRGPNKPGVVFVRDFSVRTPSPSAMLQFYSC
jgi:hypothetical protein